MTRYVPSPISVGNGRREAGRNFIIVPKTELLPALERAELLPELSAAEVPLCPLTDFPLLADWPFAPLLEDILMRCPSKPVNQALPLAIAITSKDNYEPSTGCRRELQKIYYNVGTNVLYKSNEHSAHALPPNGAIQMSRPRQTVSANAELPASITNNLRAGGTNL